MILSTKSNYNIYEVIDRTDTARPVTYSFTSIKGATRWIKELLTVFDCSADLITGYERTYTEHGDLVSNDNFF